LLPRIDIGRVDGIKTIRNIKATLVGTVEGLLMAPE
jgi:hypothetical protein